MSKTYRHVKLDYEWHDITPEGRDAKRVPYEGILYVGCRNVSEDFVCVPKGEVLVLGMQQETEAFFDPPMITPYIVVPGFVMKMSLSGDGVPVTEINPVPKEEQADISAIIQKAGFEGKISFW